MKKSAITIRDVAKHAGFTRLSPAINDSEDVSPKTRIKVQNSIKELGYRRNAFARFMALGRSHTLAFIAPNRTDFTFSKIIEGAENQMQKTWLFHPLCFSPG